MRALILVDLQNDFLPGGALAVAHGDEVIPLANRLQDKFDLIVATQDWHPPNHGSFAANHPGRKVGDIIDLHGLRQILWPIHCVQNTTGAAFAPGLKRDRIKRIFQKGTDPGIDSYSGFFDNGYRMSTGLGEFLVSQSVKQSYISGLATDYCVQFTALDARQLGFDVVLMADACRGADVNPGDSARALAEMQSMGISIAQTDDVPADR